MQTQPQRRIVVLIPVFNDWESLALLLPSLDSAFRHVDWIPQVLVVNDGSTMPMPEDFGDFEHLSAVDVLHLRRNVGHQRAIAVGLAYANEYLSSEAILVMDGDGEDRPEDVPQLLAEYSKFNGQNIVFAARLKRLESAAFRFFYHCYRALHLLLTGIAVRVGNFSIIPRTALPALVVASELWNHYTATIFRSRLPYHTVPITRGRRLIGHSKMNFAALLVHGLAAISVFSDIVGARLLVISMIFSAMTIALIVTVITIRMATDLAIPGWATYTAGFLLIILVQGLTISFLLAFSVVGARSGTGFIPQRDGLQFVTRLQRVFPRDA